MWAHIRRSINSDLAKPLNTHITEQHTSTRDLLGVINPTANTTTVMGYLRRLWDDIIANRTLIGVINPTANTTTVMGYLRSVMDAVNLRQRPFGAITSSFTVGDSTYVTVYLLNGRGKLRTIMAHKGTTASTGRIRVTIDSGLSFECIIPALTTFHYPINLAFLSATPSTMVLITANPATLDLAFKTSLRIEMLTNGGGASWAQWVVETE